MKSIWNSVLALAMGFLLAACGTDAGELAPPTSSKPIAVVATEKMEEPMKAPDFEMQDLKGNTVKLSDFAGQAIYLKYWASWCPICLGGLEDINTLSTEDTDFQILTIVGPSYKGEKNTEDFKKWFSGVENTENITVLLDEKGAYTAAAGVRGYPTSAWIDPEGNLLTISAGHKDNDAIKAGFSDTNENEEEDIL